MAIRGWVMATMALALAACAAPPPPPSSTAGDDIRVYRITAKDRRQIPFRMLDSINSLRNVAGHPPLRLDARLTAAAATHAQDMALQNRPWHFGSDGSSPLDRVRRAGYTGRLLGENISETFETELQTLAAWMEQPATRRVVMDPAARDLGFAWWQEENGKIWWTLVTGDPSQTAATAGAAPSVAATPL